jgi:molybdopterin/thiamine biosynthesis adenylyltransferase
MLVLALAAGIYGLGWRLGTPVALRWMALAGLWGGVVLAHLVLPSGNDLRGMLGGDARTWGVLGAVLVALYAYRRWLDFMKLKAISMQPANAAAGPFRPAELERYARHILLREIGGPGQQRLKSARVLVVGAGGLGSSALMYLAASGVGCIGVVDGDVVEPSNLQRQIIHTDQRIGMEKTRSAEIAMKALNPFILVRPYHRRLDESVADDLIAEYDLVLDGTDNFDTRYLVNRVCAKQGKPLVSAAMTQWEGQISLYDPARGSPCYECVFPHRPAPGMVPTCAEAGVAAPLPGIIGAMMAMEAVKHITGAGVGLAGRLMIHDALYGETRVIGIKKRADCAVCGGGH